MSNIESIDDVFAKIAGDAVEFRRKSPVLPIVLFLVGVGLTIWSVTSAALKDNSALSSMLMLTGIALTVAALVMAGITLGSKGQYAVHKNTGEKLVRYERFYDAKDRERLGKALASADLKEFSAIPKNPSSRVLVTFYCTKSGSLAMAQMSEYIPHNFEPVTEVYLFTDQGEYVAALLA